MAVDLLADPRYRDAEQTIASADAAVLQHQQVFLLGRKSPLAQALRGLQQYPPSQRRQRAQQLQVLREQIRGWLELRRQQLESAAQEAHLQADAIDISLPARAFSSGGIHPISSTIERICQLFSQLGFVVWEGPEIEDDYHNFEALNFPPNHPARDMHDTFYLDDGKLLRTHTSTVQIRALEQQAPPLKILAPGRVYRCDSDLTHSPMFHQVEGLLVEQTVSFVHLLHDLQEFLRCFFSRDTLKVRFRPSYFPFTEPSAEVDIACVSCAGSGCRICGHSGWVEVLGCGMVHPAVFEHSGIDAEKYSGYAFGMGVERLAMLYYGIDDIRRFYDNDLAFLSQFKQR